MAHVALAAALLATHSALPALVSVAVPGRALGTHSILSAVGFLRQSARLFAF